MSGPLAIGAVSAVLRNLLDSGFVEQVAPLSTVKVTAVAPDTIKLTDPDPQPSLNLFLYRVSPNSGWRNMGLPARDAAGERTSNPPLALDLHYLLTAYGTADFEAEILLGYAMSILDDHAVLDRSSIRTALQSNPVTAGILPVTFGALSASDLADQPATITVTQEPVDSEEMSRLWSAIQANYRPSVGYLVTVVLIERTKAVRSALPVLSRGPVDPATKEEAGVFVHPDVLPPVPTVFRVVPPVPQPAVALGESVRIEGVHLDGTAAEARFSHPVLADPVVQAIGVSADRESISLALPAGAAAAAAWPAGLWSVRIALVPPGDTVMRETNAAAMALAPGIDIGASSAVRDVATGAVTATIRLTAPQVHPGQKATLALGGHIAAAEPFGAITDTLTFRFGAVPGASQFVRLTIDGAESRLIKLSALDPPEPPAFDPSQRIGIA